MKDKTIEREIKIPRVRISDCCRLIFRLGENPAWRDMNSDPDLFPIYPMPQMRYQNYLLPRYGEIMIASDDTINNVVKKVCNIISPVTPDNVYLHTLIFRTTGILEIQTETI